MQLAKIRANNKVNHFKCILANGLQQPSTECTHHLRENSRFSLATFACIFSSCSGKYSLFQIPFFVFGKLHIECVCVCVCVQAASWDFIYNFRKLFAYLCIILKWHYCVQFVSVVHGIVARSSSSKDFLNKIVHNSLQFLRR